MSNHPRLRRHDTALPPRAIQETGVVLASSSVPALGAKYLAIPAETVPMADFSGLFPQNGFFLHDPVQRIHAANLSPDHLEHKSHHDHKTQRAFLQTQTMKITHLRQGRWLYDFLDAFSDLLIRRRCHRMTNAIFLNGTRVTHAAGVVLNALNQAANVWKHIWFIRTFVDEYL